MAKVKQKTHKATAKRFKLRSNGSIVHRAQGAGNGHSKSFKNRRQRKNTDPISKNTLAAGKEKQKIKRLLNAS